MWTLSGRPIPGGFTRIRRLARCREPSQSRQPRRTEMAAPGDYYPRDIHLAGAAEAVFFDI